MSAIGSPSTTLPAETDLDEGQLRELYDNEEIDRFLDLFSVRVTEVYVPKSRLNDQPRNAESGSTGHEPSSDTPSGGESTSDSLDSAAKVSIPVPSQPVYESSLQKAVRCWVIPILPPPRPPPQEFTLGGLRLTTERLFVALDPVYLPFLDHRLQITRAAELGDALSDKLLAPSFGMKETWRLFKIVTKSAKHRTKSSSKEKNRKSDGAVSPEKISALDAASDDWDLEELKRTVLNLLQQIADFHERIKKFVVETCLNFHSTVTQHLSMAPPRIVVVLWHTSIPPSERSRLPPPLGDVPTDADYAMELISKRLSSGLPVTPSKTNKKGKRVQAEAHYSDSQRTRESEPSSHSVDWKKWGDRAALGKSWADERLIHRKQLKQTTTAPDLPPRNVPSPSTIEPEQPVETHTYPVQHASGPGLVTLTTNDLLFTPLMSLDPKIIIPLPRIQSVKKTVCATLNDGEREEKFRWVGGRDELFARLVGMEGIRLAATLGSKSAFKKLPKRSILTADITQLCDLIAEPLEPLALRLSSNLLVGVARCFASLKKMVDEFRSTAVMDARLQMAQSSVRPSAVTLTANPKGVIALDFDALVVDWDEYLNIGDRHCTAMVSDDDGFELEDSETRSKRKKAKANPPAPQAEIPRTELHTLTEHYDHLLSASFDLSYHGSGNDAFGPSSSQVADFGLDDNIFAMSDGLDAGGLADELAQELGWVTPPRDEVNDFAMEETNIDVYMGFNQDKEPNTDHNALNPETPRKKLKRKGESRLAKGWLHNAPQDSLLKSSLSENLCASQPPIATPLHTASPTTSFSRLLLTQDDAPVPLQDITSEEQRRANTDVKKPKKTRLLLDARTELTDDELKTARAHYLQAQDLLRRGMDQKQMEKQSGRVLEEKVWGVPSCICAPALADFWQENFKVQVEARTGVLHIHPGDGNHPHKRRKFDKSANEAPVADQWLPEDFPQEAMDIDPVPGYEPTYIKAQDNMRSSEEPGQGRRVSREPSIARDLGIDFGTQIGDPGSQKSSMFPWDNAGGSSSSGAFGMPGSDHNVPVDHVEIRMRGSSQSRRDSSLVPSQVGSLAGGPGFSPAPIKRASQIVDEEDYAFEVVLTHFSSTPPSPNSTMSSPAVVAAKAALASIDLSSYDPEQSRLMDERCILVDEEDNAIGAMDKKTCHLMDNINKGLLHRAFSVFIFRPSDGKLLLQQRASEKITFPDMWTNTCCSHPLDDFEIEKVEKDQLGVKAAGSRKLEHELGIPQSQTPIDGFQYLTRIHYLAPSDGMWGEHEVDYILFMTADVTVTPNLNEIRAHKYVDKKELQAMFEQEGNSFTPWFKLIARDFLFGWWDELHQRKVNGKVSAKSLAGLVDGSKVVKMV
ncbi:hypothetical protein DXG01_000221 [Tephrocybe rancida]|nr:hypothetical protein DXG01_000221 [Tephrocybe rancida]